MRNFASARAQSGCSRSSLWPLKWKSPTSGTRQPGGVETLADRRNGGGGLRRVDGHPDELGAGRGERAHLRDRRGDVRGVGVGHRLHDDRRAAADRDAGDVDRPRAVPLDAGGCRSSLLLADAAVMAT